MRCAVSRFIALLGGTLVSVLIATCVCILGIVFYAFTPFPSPAPYPHSTPHRIEFAAGAGYGYETFIYTIPITLGEVKKHYEAEMQRCCVKGWQFFPCSSPADCLSAECLINRPFLTNVQSFTVQLRSSQITVT